MSHFCNVIYQKKNGFITMKSDLHTVTFGFATMKYVLHAVISRFTTMKSVLHAVISRFTMKSVFTNEKNSKRFLSLKNVDFFFFLG